MMTRNLEDIDQRLRYGETVIITRDELNDIELTLLEQETELESAQKEIEELEECRKQRDLAKEIIEGLVECIDDDGVVTHGEKKLLARRVVAAVKFMNNLQDGV